MFGILHLQKWHYNIGLFESKWKWNNLYKIDYSNRLDLHCV